MFKLRTPRLPESLPGGSFRIAFLALAGSVALAMISIAASQVLLGIALLAALFTGGSGRLTERIRLPFLMPLLLFFGWTVLAALVSSDPLLGLGIVRKFFLFLILFLVPWIGRGPTRILWAYRLIFAVAAVAGAAGILQYLADPHRNLLHRISGFMSHWMSYSGLLMLVLVALSAYIMCIGFGKAAWSLPLGLMLILSLTLSLTRNAWFGAVVGLVVVLLLTRPQAIWGLSLILVLMLAVSPGKVRDRLRSGLDVSDDNTRNRIELFETSLRLIKDNPWFGVGPKNVNVEALRYRGTQEFPDWMYQHMHNNFLQLAAERGLPGLALWLWLLARMVWDAWCAYRTAARQALSDAARQEPREALFAASASLGCCFALLAAGCFEYNFGDSEVLTLFLFTLAAPYAFLPKAEAPASPAGPCGA